MEVRVDHYYENLLISNEVVVIIIDKYGNLCELDIVFTKRINGVNETSMKWISQNYATYMPLHYVLLFLHGDKRWHEGIWIDANSR